MEVFPLNLVLAIAVAAATIFLGFLPTRNIRNPFFAREAGRAVVAWIFIAMISPLAIVQYHFFIAVLCFGAFCQFRRDKPFSAKMWLSIASGLGISIGVMLILAVTPRAYPPGSETTHSLLLASMYLGGAVIGLAYVGYTLGQDMAIRSGVTKDQMQHYVGLLLVLVLARAGVLLALLFLGSGTALQPQYHPYTTPEKPGTLRLFGHQFSVSSSGYSLDVSLPLQTMLLLGLVVIVLPAFAFAARRTSRAHLQTQTSTILIGICLVGLFAEIVARLLVL